MKRYTRNRNDLPGNVGARIVRPRMLHWAFPTSWQMLSHTSIIGAVFCHMKNHYRGDEIFVDEMFISPECQRKGHGTKLMNEVEKFAKDNSFISITLLTGKGKPAYDFYEKFGCKHLDHLAFMYKRMV